MRVKIEKVMDATKVTVIFDAKQYGVGPDPAFGAWVRLYSDIGKEVREALGKHFRGPQA